MVKERPTTTSISLAPSKLDRLEVLAKAKGFNSRTSLIDFILTEWLEKNDKNKKG